LWQVQTAAGALKGYPLYRVWTQDSVLEYSGGERSGSFEAVEIV